MPCPHFLCIPREACDERRGGRELSEGCCLVRCLVLARESFVDILGPLYSLMAREKSPAVVTQRLMKLQTKVGSPLALLCHPQQPA